METIKYKLTFLSDWHCSSGLGAGAETDNEVIKDSQGLPYIPGKTLKGLLKESCMEMVDAGQCRIEDINTIFGHEQGDKSTVQGTAYFHNARIMDAAYEEIVSNKLQTNLYRKIASTKINEKGIADQGSLRVIQVCMPIELEGTIEIEKEEHLRVITDALKWTRKIGSNRNRGLGRCKIVVI